MYNFVDVIESQEGALPPSEALKFNGEYIEDIIPGYRTLYVSGREVIEAELISSEIGVADGSKYRRKRYPSRTITVGYQLITSNNDEFRKAYNKLNSILDVEEAQLIFADEPDKYFIGTRQNSASVPTGINSITSELEFYCADPFKYAVNEKTVMPTLDDSKTFVVDYQGTYKCFPRLEAEAKADLGFVGFINQNEKIIQLGDVEELDIEHSEVSQTLIDESFYFYNSDKWILNNACTVNMGGESKQVGTVGIAQDANGESVIIGSDYVNGNVWHGPSITKVIPADANGKVGIKNCTFSWHHIYTTGTFNDAGMVQFLMSNKSADGVKSNVAAVTFVKNQIGTNQGYAQMCVNGSVKKEITFDCSWNNGVTGYNAGRSSISKFGSKFTFNLAGKIYEFELAEMATVEVNEISIYVSALGNHTHIGMSGIYSVRFVAHNVDRWKDVPNKFGSKDLISADCRNGKVKVNGVEMPGIGALGNDWEEFYLLPGRNQINCTYSSWAVKPEFKLKYREVYL